MREVQDVYRWVPVRGHDHGNAEKTEFPTRGQLIRDIEHDVKLFLKCFRAQESNPVGGTDILNSKGCCLIAPKQRARILEVVGAWDPRE